MNNTYCRLPFREISIKTYLGDTLLAYHPCCMMANLAKTPNEMNVLGVKEPHLLNPQEMYDHPRMQQLRDNLQNGVRDPACKVCWDQEDRGIKSFRQFHQTADYGYEEDGLSVIDITPSNVCNLRCRMCWPIASHQLMRDYKYFKENGLLNRVKSSIDRWWPTVAYDVSNTVQWKWMMENPDKIKVIKSGGGEPFYDKKIIQLLERYVETDNAKNTTLIFHTNATLFNDEIVELINKFKRNKHIFSIDGVGKTYEYIRDPMSFSELESSVFNYVKNVKNYDPILTIVMVVSAYNILNIDEFATWAKGVSKDVSFKFAEVYSVDRGIAIKHLPISILQKSRQQAERHLNRNGMEDTNVSNLIKMIDDAIVNNAENKNAVRNEIELFDLSRNQNYRDFLHPDLVEWMDTK